MNLEDKLNKHSINLSKHKDSEEWYAFTRKEKPRGFTEYEAVGNSAHDAVDKLLDIINKG